MANRIVSNVLIVDSAMGNIPVVGARSSMSQYKVSSMAVFSVNTTGAISVTGSNTTDVIARFNIQGTNVIQNPSVLEFGGGIYLDSIKVPVVTAATAFFYLV